MSCVESAQWGFKLEGRQSKDMLCACSEGDLQQALPGQKAPEIRYSCNTVCDWLANQWGSGDPMGFRRQATLGEKPGGRRWAVLSQTFMNSTVDAFYINRPFGLEYPAALLQQHSTSQHLVLSSSFLITASHSEVLLACQAVLYQRSWDCQSSLYHLPQPL